MSLIVNALVNLWRLVRNARARLLAGPPDFVWVEVSGPLDEFEMPVGFLRRRLALPVSKRMNFLRVRLPGGRPVFSVVASGRTPEDVLASHGLKPGAQQVLGENAGEMWARKPQLRSDLGLYTLKRNSTTSPSAIT